MPGLITSTMGLSIFIFIQWVSLLNWTIRCTVPNYIHGCYAEPGSGACAYIVFSQFPIIIIDNREALHTPSGPVPSGFEPEVCQANSGWNTRTRKLHDHCWQPAKSFSIIGNWENTMSSLCLLKRNKNNLGMWGTLTVFAIHIPLITQWGGRKARTLHNTSKIDV